MAILQQLRIRCCRGGANMAMATSHPAEVSRSRIRHAVGCAISRFKLPSVVITDRRLNVTRQGD